MFKCKICEKEFSTAQSHNAHMKIHSDKLEVSKIAASIKQKLAQQKRVEYYYANNPKLCQHCNTPIKYEYQVHKFCSLSCSATVTNLTRVRKKVVRVKKRKVKKHCFGEYSTVYLNTCKISGLKFYDRTYKKYHPSALPAKDRYYLLCKFKFNIYDYPEYFKEDIELLKEFGMYSTLGKCRNGVPNPNGVSRDHIVSIGYGLKHNIDPQIISHPANCRMMQHSENIKKLSNCGMTIDQLTEKIESFNNIYGKPMVVNYGIPMIM